MSGLEEVAAFVAIASTVAGAVSSVSAGKQQSAAYQVAAETSKMNAGTALNTSEADVARQQDRARRNVATQANQVSGSGIDLSTGSPLDVMSDTVAQSALDTEITRWRGGTQANAYLVQAGQQRDQAGQAAGAGWVNAGSTLLTAGARYGQSRIGLKVPALTTGDGMGVASGSLY